MLNGNENPDLAPLSEPPSEHLSVQYSPDQTSEIVENPPRFSWQPENEDATEYVIRISSNVDYPNQESRVFSGIKFSFFTPDVVLPPGKYVWSYAIWSAEGRKPTTNWSVDRWFEVPVSLPETPLPARNIRFETSETGHPRLWLTKARINTFKEALAKDPSHCTWDIFFEESVVPWMEREVMAEPVGYPDHKRIISVWRQTYLDCQELLYAIRHLAVGGAITGNADLTLRAKEWLLEIASWDPQGTTAHAYTDEWAFRVIQALAWGYDWLFDNLTEEEKALVLKALSTRTREIVTYIIKRAKLPKHPFNSHSVRAVSSVLIPASIVLLGHEDEAEDWLNFAIEFLATLFSPWGDTDGGWAEGTHYWMTGIASVIDAANLLRSFAGIDLYERPFFQKTGDFPLFTKAPHTRRATFGDDATLGELPGVKIAYNLRQFAGVTGNGAYQWYHDVVRANDPGTETEHYNLGWWDLNFDELVYRTDFPIVDAQPPAADDTLRWFKGIGWAAIQTQMTNPNEHVQFVIKSSPFGSLSHSHGDQNAFCISAYGEDLAIQSGHYVSFNSSMHKDWRRQTRSKNAILINGKGQYAGKDRALAMQSKGAILVAEQRKNHIYIQGDATAAYKTLSPEVTRALRDVYFINNSYFVIVDAVDADGAVSVDWLMHTNGEMDLSHNTFAYRGVRAGLYGEIVWSEVGAPTISQATGFSGIDPEDYEGLPLSTCVAAHFSPSRRHRIATLIVPYPVTMPRVVSRSLNIQKNNCTLSFRDIDSSVFEIAIPKASRCLVPGLLRT